MDPSEIDDLGGVNSGIGPVMMRLDSPLPDRITVPVSELAALYQLLKDLGNRHDQDVLLILEMLGHLEGRLMDMEHRAVKNLQAMEHLEGSLNSRLAAISDQLVSSEARAAGDFNGLVRLIRSERLIARFKSWLGHLFR